jgi:hypothetical protein
MGEHIPSHLTRLRCTYPRDHWDRAVSIGNRRIEFDENDEILVERGPHVRALERSGFIVINE